MSNSVNEQALTSTSPTPRSAIAAALFTETQRRVLALLFGQPERSFYIQALIRETGSGSGAVQRELKRLAAVGLVTTEWLGNQKHYQANPDSPIFAELRALVQKTVGVAAVLHQNLQPVADQIEAAFIFGSLAKRAEHAGSDIDLYVLSDTLGYGELMIMLAEAETATARRINPILSSPAEFRLRLKQDNAFTASVWAQEKWWIIGDASQTCRQTLQAKSTLPTIVSSD